MQSQRIKHLIVLMMPRRPEASLLKILAENVRAFRVEKGLSQEALADICSLHRTYVGSIERMERNATLATLELLAGALGVGVPELLTPREYAKKKMAQ
jgi:transcriptional regulator with XRE-family HTH domain